MAEQTVPVSVARTAAAARPGASAVQHAPRMETLRLPPTAPPTNHGRTPAAWVTTYVVLVGALVAALAMIFAAVWLFWVGIGVVVVGVVVGKVMAVLGYGKGGSRLSPVTHGH